MDRKYTYTYTYLKGGMVTVDLEDAAWLAKLDLFDKEEQSNDRLHTRWEYRVYLSRPESMDQMIVSNEPNPLQMVCMVESFEELHEKLKRLTPRQLEVLGKLLDGSSGRAIAREERKGVTTVQDTIDQLKVKFRCERCTRKNAGLVERKI